MDCWSHAPLAMSSELARAFPTTNIRIMGHCGGVLGYGPYAEQRDAIYAGWKANITELAECPNVTMKLVRAMTLLALFDSAQRRPAAGVRLMNWPH